MPTDRVLDPDEEWVARSIAEYRYCSHLHISYSQMLQEPSEAVDKFLTIMHYVSMKEKEDSAIMESKMKQGNLNG